MQMPRTQMEPTPPDETVVERGAVLEAELVTAGQDFLTDAVVIRARDAIARSHDPRVMRPAVNRQSAAAQRADG